MYNDRTVLDHGEDFLHPKLHRFLEFILQIRKEKGTDSFDYEQMIIKLATVISAITDWTLSSFPPHELHHYFEGHHKEDMNRAVKYVEEYMIMPEATNYNNKYVVRDTKNYMDTFNKQGMAEGWSKNSDGNEWEYGNKPSYNNYDSINDIDPFTYLERRPWGLDESLISKLQSNEYFRMITSRLNKAATLDEDINNNG